MGMDFGRGDRTSYGVRKGFTFVSAHDTIEEANAEIERIRRGAVNLELQADGSYAPRKS